MEVYGAAASGARMAPVAQTNAILYPNPVQSTLNFRSENLKKGDHVLVYTSTGRQVLDLTAETGSSMELNVSSLQPGIYMLRIEGKDDTYRFNKQ